MGEENTERRTRRMMLLPTCVTRFILHTARAAHWILPPTSFPLLVMHQH